MLPAVPNEANALVFCDNSFVMFVNGHQAGSGADYGKPFMVDLKPWLKQGVNIIAVEAINSDGATAQNSAGLYVYGRVRNTSRTKELQMDFVSDKFWLTSETKTAGWEQPGFAAKDWTPAKQLGLGDIAPWRLPGDTVARQFAARAEGNVRAALVVADPLMVAMGRPNREQVVTTRAETATTLQALELTNGKTLASILHKGAENLTGHKTSGKKLVRVVFEEAVGRKPNSNELKMARDLVGKKPTRATASRIFCGRWRCCRSFN